MNVFYVPCPDLASAEKISRTLLEEHLVGYTNIVPGMKSLYWWEGKIETSSEVILLLKTSLPSAAAISGSDLEKRIRELHPYSVPCLMQLSVSSINSDYEQWLTANLK